MMIIKNTLDDNISITNEYPVNVIMKNREEIAYNPI